MKKTLLVVVLVFALAIGTFASYGDSIEIRSEEFERGIGFMQGGFGTRHREDFDQRACCFDDFENLSEEERQELFKERMELRDEYREERIKLALEEGRISKEEAEEWRTHFAEMDKLREEEGFTRGRGHHMGQGRRSHGGRMMRKNF